MAKYDDLNTRQIFIIGIASVVVTVLTILAVQYVYFLLIDAHQDKLQAQSSYQRQNAVIADQSDGLSKYGADPLTGNVTIPIDKAMELVAKESQAESDNHSKNAEKEDAT